MDKNRLAKDLYTAYCEAVGGKAFNGDWLPDAETFFADPTKTKQSEAWLKAAQIPWNKLREVTSNLAHPAYGHSSATTEAIDKLRNDTFDYLGV